MLLIFPPVAKACEPPGGLPILGAVLKTHNVDYKIVDMNYEGQEFLLDIYFKDNPKKRHNRDLITTSKGYKNFDTYIKVIAELTRGLNNTLDNKSTITMANFLSSDYDSLKSLDLLKAAKNYKDNPFYEYYKNRLPKLLDNSNIKNIGISLQYLNQAVCTFSLIGYLKDNYPHIKIIIGGGLITSWVKSPYWDDPFNSVVDEIFIGPGEVQLLEYLNIEPNREKLISLKPDYDFTDFYKYYSPGRIIPISGSLGCSWKKCTFCPEKAEDNPFIAKKTAKVIEEMAYLAKRYKPTLFHFLDNEINPSVLKAITESNNSIPWYGFTKFYSNLKDLDFCKKLKTKGCFMLKLGLESGDQKVLDSMNKGIELQDVVIILKNLKEAGIKTFIYILFGTPAEDYKSAIKTMDFLIKFHSYITYLNMAIFNLPINSEISRQQDTYNFSDADLTLYSGFNHPKGWNRKNIRDFLKKELKQKEKIKDILNRTPPIFNANHAYFFNDLK